MKRLTSEEQKKIALDILRFTDEFCRENNLKYFIFYGTLIGAIRHKGMIPWDDDIDICLPREDYNRLITLMNGRTDYQVVSFETNPTYYWASGRICDCRTILTLKNIPMVDDFGVFVDIFPIDEAAPDSEINDWFNHLQSLRLKVRHNSPLGVRYFQYKGLVPMLKVFYGMLLRMFKSNRKFEYYKEAVNKCMTQYNGSNSDKYLVCSNADGLKALFPKEYFATTVDLDFEDMKLMAPVGYDAILKQLYGNYMELPPIEKRCSHHRFVAYWK